ncbi:MAG: hypothetical protein BWX54_02031 [Verrucomicrobia bacterium ADurb.Bin018]|nr:MAG: hypothetical protein BWX54_02031 [Verrucomicrobia bacterium ADurb.Bin018]
MTNIGVSSLEGADMTTRLAPAWMCPSALAFSRKKPVDSQMYSAPTSPHLSAAGSFSAVRRMFLPLTTSALSAASTVPLNAPWMLSYFSMYASCLESNKSLMPTTSICGFSIAARKTNRPMRPNPLMPTLIAIFVSPCIMFDLPRPGLSCPDGGGIAQNNTPPSPARQSWITIYYCVKNG